MLMVVNESDGMINENGKQMVNLEKKTYDNLRIFGCRNSNYISKNLHLLTIYNR